MWDGGSGGRCGLCGGDVAASPKNLVLCVVIRPTGQVGHDLDKAGGNTPGTGTAADVAHPVSVRSQCPALPPTPAHQPMTSWGLHSHAVQCNEKFERRQEHKVQRRVRHDRG